MAREKKVVEKETTKELEKEVKETKKEAKVTKLNKADIKKAKKLERVAIMKEKEEVEKQIDALVAKKKATKAKDEKKAIKAEIKALKAKRNNIGKKDTFLRDVKKEMKLVRWPNKKEVFKYSLACLIFIIFFALFFYAIDVLFAYIDSLLH